MKKEILTSEKILDYLEKNPGISSTQLAKYFGVTPVAIFYHVRDLLKIDKISVIGKSRATRYFIKKSFLIPYNTHPIFSQIKKELEDTYNHIPEIDIEKVLRDILLILLPDGEWKE